jgi:hypothetical protein
LENFGELAFLERVGNQALAESAFSNCMAKFGGFAWDGAHIGEGELDLC